MPIQEGTYGILAEFDTPSDLVRAAQAAYDSGYRRMDCYTPYPVEEAAEAIGFHRDEVSLICLIGGLLGLAAPCSAWKPGSRFGLIRSALLDVLITHGQHLSFRPTSGPILFAGLSAAFGMLALNLALPTLYHPLFNAPNFRNGATTDKFFLCLEANDPKFEESLIRASSSKCSPPVSVVEVEY